MIRELYNRARECASDLARRGKAAVVAFGTAGSMVAMNAQAALTLDSTAILADIATVVGFITTVGLAILGLVYTAKALGWAKKAG